MSLDLDYFEKLIIEKIRLITLNEEPAHDFLHFARVSQMAKKLCALEKASIEVVMPAAWLHDFVIVPKNDPRRKIASRLSAESGIQFLSEINYPKQYFDQIFHAIEAHSFSANIETKNLEAKVVQDADRLDGLGAIGIARCFATAGVLKRSFYSSEDPFCTTRSPDDSVATIDHFYTKLFKTVNTLKTKSGQLEASKRVQVMKKYLDDLKNEI